MIKGIDVSENNGDIDMSAIKEAGIDFVIIRIGYGKNQSQIDKKFKVNYENAIKNNIPVGIYLYSYATNIVDAEKEAKLVLNNIKGIKIEYPIFIDMEDADDYKAKRNVSNETCIDICEKFCLEIENAGYYAGIYANLDWLNNRINSSKLDRFDKWVAQWNSTCTYKKNYGMWQYSNKGKVNGIKGNVDLNYAIYDYLNIIKNAGLNNLSDVSNNIVYYTVQPGDNLSKIAEKFDGITWQEIYELNKETIGDNPNLIHAGLKLMIRRN